MKKTRQRIDVNLDELDRIIDHGTHAPLSESDGQKLKGALHALAELLTPARNNEKTNAVLPNTADESRKGTTSSIKKHRQRDMDETEPPIIQVPRKSPFHMRS